MGVPKKTSRKDWKKEAQKILKRVIKVVSTHPGIRGPRGQWEMDLSLLSLAQMTEVNRVYRGKSGPTDVLSFPAPDPFFSEGHLGELMVCLPVLKSQAQERKIPLEAEIQIVLVHGVLHLLGFDHEGSPRDAKKMATLETHILKKLVSKQWLKTYGESCVRGLIERVS